MRAMSTGAPTRSTDFEPRPGCRTAAQVALALVAFVVAAAQAANAQPENINPFLGPQYADWLVGAIGEIASEEERSAYLLLEADEEAAQFSEEFWQQPGQAAIRELYERRFAEAEKRFAEGVYAGGRSDRGTIFVLYGEPEMIEYEEFRDVRDPDVEVWRYPKKAEPGLDGERPQRTYRFVRVDDRIRRFERGDRFDPATQRRRQPDSLPTVPPFPGGSR